MSKANLEANNIEITRETFSELVTVQKRRYCYHALPSPDEEGNYRIGVAVEDYSGYFALDYKFPSYAAARKFCDTKNAKLCLLRTDVLMIVASTMVKRYA